jgi:DNA-directed RNA polymerase subunit alpha
MDHQIHLPSTIEFVKTDRENVEQVVVTPCSQGYGTTLGNAFRRVLLSSLPGAAVESIKIDGVQHEFSAVEGVQEDVIEIILNLKQLAVKVHTDEPVTLSLSKKGKGPVTAKDFDKNADVEISNDDMVIATITDDKKTLDMEITVANGQGYVPVAKKETKHLDLGTISIDSLYTPIRDVGYNVEMTRVGDVTDYEKLILTVETDGTITPQESIEQATKILMDHFALMLGGSDSADSEEE